MVTCLSTNALHQLHSSRANSIGQLFGKHTGVYWQHPARKVYKARASSVNYPAARLTFVDSRTSRDAASEAAFSQVSGIGNLIKVRKRRLAKLRFSYNRGNRILNVVPFPSSLVTVTVPFI